MLMPLPPIPPMCEPPKPPPPPPPPMCPPIPPPPPPPPPPPWAARLGPAGSIKMASSANVAAKMVRLEFDIMSPCFLSAFLDCQMARLAWPGLRQAPAKLVTSRVAQEDGISLPQELYPFIRSNHEKSRCPGETH